MTEATVGDDLGAVPHSYDFETSRSSWAVSKVTQPSEVDALFRIDRLRAGRRMWLRRETRAS